MKRNDIKEVARIAGVSPSTVSRTINHPEMVNEITRERILEIVNKLNYQANSSARGLKGYGTSLILASFGDKYPLISASNYYQALIPRIVEKFENKNYHLIMSMHMHDTDLSSIIALSRKNIFDLTILMAPQEKDERLVQLNKMKEKFLVLGNPDMKFEYNWVETDSYGGSKKATELLLERGYEKLIFIGMEEAYHVSKIRYEGFSDVVKNKKIENISYKNCQPIEKCGYKIGREISVDKKTGIFCAADILAIGFMKAQFEKDLIPGGDYGIIGYDALIDGVKLGDNIFSLTSVKQDIELISETIVKQCLKIIDKENPCNIMLPVSIRKGNTV